MSTVNTIPYADKFAVVNIDCTIWTGQAKLTPDALPADIVNGLPPADLATLGSLRLFPDSALKHFRALKARGITAMQQVGVRFLSGWAVDKARLDDIGVALSTVQSDFYIARDNLLRDYAQSVANWQAAYPQWAHVLQRITPTEHEVARRFKYDFQCFTVGTIDGAPGAMANTIQSLPDAALQSLADDAKALMDTSFSREDRINAKSFAPFGKFMERVRALAFIDRRFGAIRTMLSEMYARISTDGRHTDATYVQAFRAIMSMMATFDGIRAMAESIMDASQSVESIWESQFNAASAPADSASESTPVQVDTTPDFSPMPVSEIPQESQTVDPYALVMGLLEDF